MTLNEIVNSFNKAMLGNDENAALVAMIQLKGYFEKNGEESVTHEDLAGLDNRFCFAMIAGARNLIAGAILESKK